jgi:hypothetical protein
VSERKDEDVETEAAALWKAGADIEALLRLMRERGFGQAASNASLIKVPGMDGGMVQSAVLKSETWADQRERNTRIQEELAQTLFELSHEDNPNFKLTLERDPDSSEPT